MEKISFFSFVAEERRIVANFFSRREAGSFFIIPLFYQDICSKIKTYYYDIFSLEV
jgi:hypothetical protein